MDYILVIAQQVYQKNDVEFHPFFFLHIAT